MKIIGYTQRQLKKTKLFKNGLIESTSHSEVLNELKVCFCSKSKFDECSILKICLRLEPQVVHDKRLMGGRTVFQDINIEDEENIKKYLKRSYKKCRRIEIDIKEIRL